jgi:hypothetical protein
MQDAAAKVELGTSGISGLDEKVLPLYRQGPSIHLVSGLEVYVASVTKSIKTL